MKIVLGRSGWKCLWVLLLSFVAGCDMIEYHPYDLDIEGRTGINKENVAEIKASTEDCEEISFAVISDTQRWYDETEDAVADINRRGEVDFVLHTGDLSDFGAKLEFELQRDILEKLAVPYVCLLGNHDCVATGKQVFNKIFGDDNFVFIAGNVQFVCVNTNALEFDYSQAVPDLSFIRDCLENTPNGVIKTVVAMHAGPYSEQFNNNIADVFEFYIRQFPDLQFCVYGHGHQLAADDFFNDGVMYYQCPCAKKRAYLRFTINNDGYEYEVVEF